MVETEASKQIRPKIRSKVATQPAENAKPEGTPIRLDKYDAEVEETRQRMKKWMGLGSIPSNNNDDTTPLNKNDIPPPRSPDVILGDDRDTSSTTPVKTAISQQCAPGDSSSVIAAGKPAAKSILKNPKYTKQSTAPFNEPCHAFPNQVDDSAVVHKKNPICKNVVVERDPTQPMRKRIIKPRPPNAQSHSAVEGYVPSTVSTILPPISVASAASDASVAVSFEHVEETNKKAASRDGNDDDTSPLVLTSLEELFEAAGHVLPPQHDPNKVTPDAMLLEADIAFSVMTQDQYDSKLSELKEQHEEERQAQLKIFLGSEKIFDDEATSQEGGDDSSDDDDDDDDLLEVLMGGGVENADDYFDDGDGQNDMDVDRQPRAFRLLWDTLSEWITPEAIQYLTRLKETAAADSSSSNQPKWTPPAVERSDVEASRCAGLMAMVKLYLPKSLEELGFPSEVRRTADVRLGELLRTFNFVQEAPKLPVKLWKAMTCILLEIVLVKHGIIKDDDNIETKKLELPPSIATVEMTTDEYHYLTHTLVKTFGLP